MFFVVVFFSAHTFVLSTNYKRKAVSECHNLTCTHVMRMVEDSIYKTAAKLFVVLILA